MAQSLYSVESIIKSTYSLQVAVRCSSDADNLCRKNQLTFCELLEPFSQLSSPVQSKDLQGHPYTLKNVHVRFTDPQIEPTSATELQRILSEVVKSGGWESKQPHIRHGTVTTSATTPWYDGYRNTFLGKLRPEDREPIRHYVSVLLVVSSSEPEVMEAFANLYTKQKESEQSRNSNWLTPHMFYSHVLLHDVVEGDITRAKDNLAQAQATYGTGSCLVLRINSRQHGSVVLGENPWSRVARHHNSINGEDEPDGISSKFKFSIGKHKNKKTPKNSKNPSPPTNHTSSSSPIASSPISPVSSPSVSVPPPPPLLQTTSISPPPSISSTASLPSLPTDTHPLLEGTAPVNHELIIATPPTLITPNVREEATLEQSSSEESLPESNQNSSSPILEGKVSRGRSVGSYLSADDEEIVRAFVSEFVGQRLVPHLEAVLKNLNEWLISRRSVRRSISSMGKRFFGMLGGQLNNTAIDEPSYASSSQEFQTRQFADLSFLLQSYEQALLNYSTVKKDYHSSSAWMHYSKTVEMCAVTAYMMSSTRREIVPLFEEAISMFTISCKSPVNALRCSMMLCEIMKERGLYRELTQVYIKMTTEESDLHSAVCLEQAAHSFLRIHPSMSRKYALHLILAGHRFAKSGQRVHSARVYTQSLELYRGKGWTLAEDYVHFSLARHCFSLQRLRDARLAFEHLLGHESVQTAHQQMHNLREYIYVHKMLLSDSDYCSGQQVKLESDSTSLTSADRVQSVPLLPIPFINSSLTRVVLQTGIGVDTLQHLIAQSSKDRVSESNVHESGREGEEVVNSLDKERMRELLLQITNNSSISNQNTIIVGARDYNPLQIKGTTDEWRRLEEIAARGPRGTPRENFQPSIVIMDDITDNSKMPHCVVNESVGVGVVLRNPLKVPLVMRSLALTWSHTPLPSNTQAGGSSVGEGERARADVMERIVLQPLSEKMVVLRITPLCEGELTVLGFIYHLCVDYEGTQQQQRQSSSKKGSESPGRTSQLPSLTVSSKDTLYQKQQNYKVQQSLAEGVQGRVEFSVQGRRLNRTKEHKTGVVYGPDHRLHWRITSPMPRALVSVSGVPSGVLCGEVCRMKVEVVNCGHVPLNSFRLTSSAAGRLLLDTNDDTSRCGSIYPSSSSSSPSLLSSRHQTPPCIELPLPSGRLDPGGGVSVGVVLQTIDPHEKGEVPWNLLFYYEPTLITSHSTMTHRVLQSSHVLSVRESLVLKTTATPTQSPTTTHDRFDLNQLVVMLEAENKCQQALEMRILQVSCVSRKWSIQCMDKLQGIVSLLPKEAGIIPLKASCHTHSHSTSGDTSRNRLCFSDVALGPTTISSQKFPVLDLLSASSEYQELMWENRENREGIGWSGKEERRERNRDHSDVILIVFWQAHSTDGVCSYGHHTTSVRLPQSMNILTKPSLRSVSPSHSPYDLVKHYLDHPASIKPNFSTIAYCQVPVIITLQNCCHCTVQVIVELLHPREVSQDTKTSSKHLVPESSTLWTGSTCQRHISLDGNSLQTLKVYANFTRAGVYNLQNIKVWSKMEGDSGDYHLQRWQRTSLISVVE